MYLSLLACREELVSDLRMDKVPRNSPKLGKKKHAYCCERRLWNLENMVVFFLSFLARSLQIGRPWTVNVKGGKKRFGYKPRRALPGAECDWTRTWIQEA
jgi:hypothetical protein